MAYKRVELSFDAADQLDSVSRYASAGTSELVASSSFAYDDASRLTSITHAKGASTLAEYRWQYDENNRVSAFSSLVDGTAFYTYDDRDQLTGEFYVDQYIDSAGDFQAISSGGYSSTFQPNLTYQYDANGNRRRRAEVNLPNLFDPDHVDFDPATQFTPIGDADTSETHTESGITVTSTDDFNTDSGTHNRLNTDGTHNYLFDDQGNRVRKTHIANDTVQIYTWDVKNRLVKVTNYASTADADAETNATQVVDHIYDLNDRWIGKKVDTDGDGDVDVTERYVYDGNQIALRFVDEDSNDETEGDELANRYLWGAAVDQLFAQEDVTDIANEGDVLWALTDNLNTVRDAVEYDDVADEANVVNHRTYEAFGKVASETNPSDSQSAPAKIAFGYTGKIFEEFTKLQQNHCRWYDAATGKWMSQDPVEDDKTNNDRYVGNNPVNKVDPDGLMEIVPPGRGNKYTARNGATLITRSEYSVRDIDHHTAPGSGSWHLVREQRYDQCAAGRRTITREWCPACPESSSVVDNRYRMEREAYDAYLAKVAKWEAMQRKLDVIYLDENPRITNLVNEDGSVRDVTHLMDETVRRQIEHDVTFSARAPRRYGPPGENVFPALEPGTAAVPFRDKDWADVRQERYLQEEERERTRALILASVSLAVPGPEDLVLAGITSRMAFGARVYRMTDGLAPIRGFTGAGLREVDEWAESAYAAIRALKRTDIDTIAKNTGLSADEILTLKKHLFYGKHRLPAEGGQGFYRARFTADDEIAYAWQQALKGELSDAQKAWFKQLADHELAERGFMAQGIPYRNPKSWNPENEMWKSFPPGAHDLSPAAPGYGRFPGFSDWYDDFFN